MKLNSKTNISDVIQDLADYGGRVRDETAELIDESLRSIQIKAQRNAPVDDGVLRSSIQVEHVKDPKHPFGYVEVRAKYGPFVEFGTKSKTRIPAGLEGLAQEWKAKARQESKGDFQDLVNKIKVWAPKHGIPKDAAFIIAVNIVRDGVEAQPFLFPAYFSEVPEIEKGLIRILKKVK